MCSGCRRLWTFVHALTSIVYVACGIVQLVAGIFLFMTVPELRLSGTICAGAWNVILGITAGMIACFAQLSTRRQESLLYISVSIIVVNAVNAVLSEWLLYRVDLSALTIDCPYETLITDACLAMRIAIGVIILTSFFDSQLAFCSLQVTKKIRKKVQRSHEQVSDIEYIIPRAKSSKPNSIYHAYTQSWVFEADNSSYTKPAAQNGNAPPTNPTIQVHIASDDCKTNCLKSFTPQASPTSSQLNLIQSNPPINEYLEQLTEPSVYRSRLNSALSNKEDASNYQIPQSKRVEAITPQSEKVQYASLMQELQKAIGSKRDSPHAETSSNSSDTDDFSKELEAALQLIQELESPNTIETPSEPKSEKTSPQELCSFKPATQGKPTRLVVHCDSQSTSGYSSPTLKSHSYTPVNWSTASSINSSHNNLTLNTRTKGRSITLDDEYPFKKHIKRSSSGTGSLWNMRSLLRMKKQELPKLSPELEGAIIKSESLAYLSELELLARHQRSKDLERQVEQRVLQQMGRPKTDPTS